MARRPEYLSPYPSMPRRKVPGDPGENREPGTPEEWWDQVVTRFMQSISDLSGLIEDHSHRVDEYQVQALGTNESVLSVQTTPDYEMYPEIIESVIVTGPSVATTTSPTQGTVGNNAAIAAATAGGVALPSVNDSLSGFDIQLSTVGTAAMTVTVSNVTGGPYTYTIPTGQQSLSVRYPVPLNGFSGPPQIAWSSTASAVGNASIYGIANVAATATSTPFTLVLGKRSWNLNLPPSGILVIAPVKFSLGRNDTRLLTSATAGDWGLELSGYADVTYRWK